jgi:hypothetical protein
MTGEDPGGTCQHGTDWEQPCETCTSMVFDALERTTNDGARASAEGHDVPEESE